MFPTILIVDDEASIRQSLSGLLADEGFDVITASNGYEALKRIETESPDLVLLDIWMPGIDGIETLKEIKKDNPFIQVLIITGHGTIETAIKAVKFGAFDLIEKPLSIDKVIVAINNALNFRRLEEENRYLRKKTIEKNSINGNSPVINDIKRQIAQVAQTDSWILICGENGSGKELVARTIHQLSPRADKPLIDVSCAAIPEELIESELFGQEKGVLAAAGSKKRGKFELAGDGTLFFDEIGDMSLKTQGKILRVLQEQQFQRVGGSRTIQINVRVIASTNKNLEMEIEEGRFRQELYYRLNVVPIHVPPLRERADDIPALAETFLADYAKRRRSAKKQISQEAIAVLKSYTWPGNVRELKNLIERLSIMVDSDMIDISHIPEPYNPVTAVPQPTIESDLFAENNLNTAMESFRKEFIKRKMTVHGYDLNKTAEVIGMTPDELTGAVKTMEAQAK